MNDWRDVICTKVDVPTRDLQGCQQRLAAGPALDRLGDPR
jgi:hypothetical protein